jgi:hypothetical protein
MDCKSYKETLHLVGKIVIQFGLPSGDPCWIAKFICSYIDSPLESLIKQHRHAYDQLAYASDKRLLVIKNEPQTAEQSHLRQKAIHLTDKLIAHYKPLRAKLYDIIATYHTPETRNDIELRCFYE